MTNDQINEVLRIKQYFPYRIAYGALNPQTGEFIASAATSMRPINKLVRDGWQVWQISTVS